MWKLILIAHVNTMLPHDRCSRRTDKWGPFLISQLNNSKQLHDLQLSAVSALKLPSSLELLYYSVSWCMCYAPLSFT